MSVSEQSRFKLNDEIDPISLLNVLFKILNTYFCISPSFFITDLLSAVTPMYQSSSLLEIRKDNQGMKIL